MEETETSGSKCKTGRSIAGAPHPGEQGLQRAALVLTPVSISPSALHLSSRSMPWCLGRLFQLLNTPLGVGVLCVLHGEIYCFEFLNWRTQRVHNLLQAPAKSLRVGFFPPPSLSCSCILALLGLQASRGKGLGSCAEPRAAEACFGWDLLV